MFTLKIHRTPVEMRPVPGTVALHELRGGPAQLLEWLETQLGCPLGRVTHFERTRRYLAALARTDLELCARSLMTDAWSTAAELLARRDELRLAGWDPLGSPVAESWASSRPQDTGEAARTPSALVRDLLAVERTAAADPNLHVFPGEAERIGRICAALDAEQELPQHVVVLEESVEEWPVAWRPLLARLETTRAPAATLLASAGTALRAAQQRVTAIDVSSIDPGALASKRARAQGGERSSSMAPDASLCFARAASAALGCRAVAALLAEAPERIRDTVILCEDTATALVLDDCLAELGLPTMGVTSRSFTQPALQVLPLVLELCWEPVDPQLLLDFLTLPVRPLSSWLTNRLVSALAEQPGLGSERWNETRVDLTRAENDVSGEAARTLARWLDHERHPRSAGLPAALIVERCRVVAKWATQRAVSVESAGAKAVASPTTLAIGIEDSTRQGTAADGVGDRDPLPSERTPADLELARTLRAAAAQAYSLAEIVEGVTERVTEAQLPRLLEATLDFARRHPRPALVGMPRYASCLSQIHASCERLIWLGVGTNDPRPPRWTHGELRCLTAAGIEVDDGRRALVHARRAERRGFALVRSELLVVQLPADDERRPHPIWTQIRAALSPRDPVSLEQWIAEPRPTAGRRDRNPDSHPWASRIPTRALRVPTRELPPVVWRLDPDLLRDRESSSASELQDRLGCPLKWAFRYQARLRPSDIGNLQTSFLLKGNFSHHILAAVFGAYAGSNYSEAKALPSVEEAVERVAARFDERIGLDAAPLAQPNLAAERAQLRRELLASTRGLMQTLRRGGYRILGLEVPIESTLHGRKLRGYVDCLLVNADQNESVVDFKYGGPTKYRALIEQGRAVQLATYAGARHRQSGLQDFPRVGYLIISTAEVLTPEHHGLLGAEEREQVPGAPSIQQVWIAFQDALAGAEEWFETGEIPIRPRQSTLDWPRGADLVLDAKDRPSICDYCRFDALCGMKEVR